ncbi:MAG TPA: alpha/beta fold hydrolase [Ktedonobacterales bacterium]|nr:alpha/beta fold hydrolase [Ktedonobacterales bacterium]
MRIARGSAAAIALVLVLAGLAACGESSTASAPPTPIPTRTPFPTPSPTFTLPSHAVTFTTSDHVQLAGTLYGQGKTFVIFSNQTDTIASSWTAIAQQFAARGYAALCYDYRGRGNSQGTRSLGPSLMTDLRAAVAFAQRQGAQRIMLVGASIGGAVTANVAASTSVAAVAIISAPSDFPQVEVSDATMASISAPKLLMDSQSDVYAQAVQAMYDAAHPPKDLQMYPGADHGLDLLTGTYGTQAMQRLLAFAQQYAPAIS